MDNVTTTANPFYVPSVAWSRSCPLAGPATRAAKHAQKRFTMAGTDIDGWPLGPRDGTSG